MKSKRILSIDLETYSELDIKKVGGYKYAENAEVLLFGYAFNDEPAQVIDLPNGETLPPEVRRAIFDAETLKVAYNASFERTVLGRWFSELIQPDTWFCTMVQAYTLGLPGGLDIVSKVLRLSEDKAKMSEGKQLIQYFCKPCKPTKRNGERTRNLPKHAPDKWAQFKDYCRRDVETERTIRKMMRNFTPNDFERRLWFLDQRINDCGVKIDTAFVENAIQADAIFKAETMSEAKALSGIENPNSRNQVLDWFEEQEGYLPKKLDKEAVAGLLESLENDKVKKMLRLKQFLSKTSVKKYESMQRACCDDGRVHGALQFYGAARTGRWAGRLVQLHNLPRNAMDDLDTARVLLRTGEFDVFEFFYENVPDTLSQLIRTAFVAGEGNRFIVADFSAIEARVIAWLAGEKWRLDVFAGDGKIYEASAAQMFHVPVETIDKHSPLRQKGKVAELACGYGGGPVALIQMGALKGGLTEEELPGIIRRWRKASPKIVKMWWDAEKCAIEAVKNKTRVKYHYGIQFAYESGMLFIRLPSGRRLAYVRPRLEPEPKFNKIGLTYEGAGQETGRKGSGGWLRQRTYGGKLVENIIQAIARDCLAVSMMRLDEAGYRIVMHVHDEVVCEMPEGQGSVVDACEIMGRPIDWAKGLILRAEGYETKYYKKD